MERKRGIEGGDCKRMGGLKKVVRIKENFNTVEKELLKGKL